MELTIFVIKPHHHVSSAQIIDHVLLGLFFRPASKRDGAYRLVWIARRGNPSPNGFHGHSFFF
jgi:hypothetical protein